MSKKNPTPRQLNAIDRHVAGRLRSARIAADMSQEEAGDVLGVSFQQIQKYEKATNRLSVGKLALLAQAFGKSVDWMLEGAPLISGRRMPVADIGAELLAVQGGKKLAEAFLSMPEGRRGPLTAYVQTLSD